MTNLSGHCLGHYHLQERIGSGGYADVYKARDIFLDRIVAVKVLKVRTDPHDLQDILWNAHEARTAANLKHPLIVEIIEFNIHNNIPYIVMRYAKNGSLRSIHPLGEPLAWYTIIDYVHQIAEALTFIHSYGIVHQDVKPENILLGDSHEILVSDFGTVAFIQNTGPQNVRECIGTVNYMAPERFTLDSPTPASDIYSLAVVVFEWLTGERLFLGTTYEIIQQHKFFTPSSKRMTVLGIAPGIQRVLLKALAKNPRSRYQSAEGFSAALERAVRISQQQIAVDEHRARWEEMPPIFIAGMVISLLLAIGFYLLDFKLVIDLLIFQASLLLLPLLIALIRKNWVVVGLELVISVIAAFVGLLLHSGVSFGWTFAFSLIFCSFIGVLRSYRY